MTGRVLKQRFSKRSLALLVLHALAFAASLWLAFALRAKPEFVLSQDEWLRFALSLPAFVVFKLFIFSLFGQYHHSWRTVTLSDLAGLLQASLVSSISIALLDFSLISSMRIGGAVLLLDFLLTILIVGGLRAASRLFREEFRYFHRSDNIKVIIVGANQSGQALARYLIGQARPKYRVLSYLDSDLTRRGSLLGGVPILGAPERACEYAHRIDADQIMVISGTLLGKQLREMMDAAAAIGVTLKVIPAFDDLLSGDFKPQIRDVEINDLLRREPVQLSGDAIAELLEGRDILVTGAGGSIGSEICRQVLRFKPRRLVLVERAENSLFLIEQELARLHSETEIIPAIADITDYSRIDALLGQIRPSVVFHAAAHKHVPMMEHNPGEALKNNVLGTKQLVELAHKHEVQEFVMISTDKAVNPTSIMGVSKQLAERYVHAYSEISSTKFVVVRFGNVLASNGSVVPTFQEQIRRGGPVTVTHPDMERFFMTIPEASQLVLQAAAMGNGGEIFVLDMGESVKIVNLARDLIRLSGLRSDEIEIVFTGLRPGEKLYEELYFGDEEMLPTPHSKVFVAYHRPYLKDEVDQLITELTPFFHAPPDAVRAKVAELVPEYRHPAKQAAAASNGELRVDPAHTPVTAPVMSENG